MNADRSRTDDGVAVVGAGPGGLAAAVLLASRGVPVTVYESAERIGGRTRRISLGEYHFDCGPTFFLMPHVLDEVFRAAGRSLHEACELKRLDPMYRLVIGSSTGVDTTIDATQDVSEMARRIGAVHPKDGERFAAFIRHNRAKLDAAEPILRRPIRSVFDLVRPDGMRAATLINPHLTVQQLLGRYFEHPAVQLAVGFQSKYLGMSPFNCPSLFTILPFIEYEFGVWHPIGGCNALMDALATVLIDLGGRIETGVPVEGVRLDGRRVTGLHLGGRRAGEAVSCAHAVINADATWAIKRFFPQSVRGRESDARIDRRKYSCSTYMLYLGVEGELDLPHHTIRTAPDYVGNLEDIQRDGGSGGTLTEDPSFYVCNASATDPTLAPEGHSSVYVLMPTPNCRASIDWQEAGPRSRELLLDRMASVLGQDVRGRIREERAITPDDWLGMNINFGATFNLAHSLDQMLHRRPQNRLPFVDGGWLVGGGTHPGSGLPVIFLSAQITATMLLAELGIEAGFERLAMDPWRFGAADASRGPAVVETA